MNGETQEKDLQERVAVGSFGHIIKGRTISKEVKKVRIP